MPAQTKKPAAKKSPKEETEASVEVPEVVAATIEAPTPEATEVPVELPESEQKRIEHQPEPKLFTRRQLEIASLTGAQRAYTALLFTQRDRMQPQQLETIKGLLYPVLYAMSTLGVQIQTTQEFEQWKAVNVPKKVA